ncbi:MAG: YceH family protein [Acidimicrobiia bacterium]
MVELSDVEIRVLGCLMEKQVTTPDLYPLTVNALIAACNQSTNRNPVVRYVESDVVDALTLLRNVKLTRIVYSPSNRAPKHRHVADEVLMLDPAEQAVLCVLMLRGAQTVGELKTRTERQHDFENLAEIEAVLDALASREEPLVRRLERQPGQKDARYVHLLGGETLLAAMVADAATPGAGRADRADRIAELETRIEALERQVAALTADIERLRPLLD